MKKQKKQAADQIRIEPPYRRDECGSCEHFDNFEGHGLAAGYGKCRRYPPVMMDNDWSLPSVGEADWCGEFRACR